jgi:hypothetical protein
MSKNRNKRNAVWGEKGMRRIVPQTFRSHRTRIDGNTGMGLLKKGRGTKNCVGKGLAVIVNEPRSYDGQVFFD